MNTETVVAQIRLSGMAFAANASGISHEESLIPPEGGGNCFNWIAGHLVKSRRDLLMMLGSHGDGGAGPELERYAQGSSPIAGSGDAASFPALLDQFTALQQPMLDAIQGASAELLAKAVPNSPTGNPDETVGSMLPAIAFHEAYHIGQMGLLRRILEKDRILP